MSYKVEVQADNSGAWCSNQLRFTTYAEAQGYGADLQRRWSAVRLTAVRESSDPVNARFLGKRIVFLKERTNGRSTAN